MHSHGLGNCFKYFKYYVEHKCTYPGCGTTLVLDGNMKNHRDVCYAKEAGFMEFEGLSGSIKTGCPSTPAFKSRYCSEHKDYACSELHHNDIDEDFVLHTGKGPYETSIVEKIVDKKTTRKQTYYQVKHACNIIVHVYYTIIIYRYYGLVTQSATQLGSQPHHSLKY